MNPCRLYTLKVWPDRQRFHAALRAVDASEELHFHAAGELCEFLSRATAPAAAPGATGETPDASTSAGDARPARGT
jgi:hypothetical protein